LRIPRTVLEKFIVEKRLEMTLTELLQKLERERFYGTVALQ